MSALLLAAIALAPQKVNYVTVSAAKKNYYTTSTRTPVLTGSPLADFATQRLKAIAAAGVAAWMKESAVDWKTKPRLESFYQALPMVSLVTPEVVSMYFTVNTFNGGAHPMSVYDPHTFAYVGGKPVEVRAKDLFLPGADFKSVVSSLVLGKLMHNDRAEWVQNGQVKSLTPAQVDSFVVTRSGLTFLFDPYDMGPYAVGSFQVKVPFTEMAGDLASEGPLKSLLR